MAVFSTQHGYHHEAQCDMKVDLRVPQLLYVIKLPQKNVQLMYNVLVSYY
jgi:hypothetical protein